VARLLFSAKIKGYMAIDLETLPPRHLPFVHIDGRLLRF
jgi:hypothetical protein